MLNKFKSYIKRKDYMLNNFKENASYLYPGEYVFDNSLTYICLKDEDVLIKANELFGNSIIKYSYKIIFYILKKVYFNKSIIITCQNNHIMDEFKGNIYLPANNNNTTNDAKIFDFANKKVLSIFSTTEKMKSEIENYNTTKDFFSIPKIINHDFKNLYIVEEIIDVRINELWTNSDNSYVMNEIINQYINYLSFCKREYNYSFNNINNLIIDSKLTNGFITKFKKSIDSELLNLEFPFVKLHGDLWSSNILLENNTNREIYIIDWEHAGDYLFFYDLFWFMQSEAVNNKNYDFINEYFLGEYDDCLIKMFNMYNLTFYKKYRIDYFKIFCINVFITRIGSEDEFVLDVVYNQFEKLIDKFE